MRTSVLVFALGLAACDQRADVGDLPGRDGGVNDVGASNDPVTRFCNDLYAIKCAASPTCCSDSSKVYDSQAECVAEEAGGCIQEIGEIPVYRLGKATLAAEPARGLLAEVERAADGCLNEGGYGPPLVGTIDRGGDCTFTLSDGFFMACAPGLACLADGVEGAIGHELYRAHCDSPLGLGASCIVGAPGQCAPGHYCDGTCKPELPRNATCTDSRACEGRLTCSPATQRCELPTFSADDAYCFAPSTGTSSTPRVNDGPEGCSSTTQTGSGTCFGEWVCPSVTYRVECARNGDVESCRCLKDAVEVGNFDSTANNVCTGGGAVALWSNGQLHCAFP